MIKSKVKKCKGTGKAKGHGCGKETMFRKYGLCMDGDRCFQTWLTTTEEGNEVMNKTAFSASKKVKSEKEKSDRKRLHEAKFKLKTIATLIQEARTPFQKLIRIRDHGKTCPCCNKPLPFYIGDYDGGHCFKAELYTGIIFHPDNVHGQLVGCNQYDHGNEAGYTEGLKVRLGVDRFEKLKELAFKTKQYSWDRETLFNMKEYYSKCLREVEKGIKNINDIDLSIGIVTIN